MLERLFLSSLSQTQTSLYKNIHCCDEANTDSLIQAFVSKEIPLFETPSVKNKISVDGHYHRPTSYGTFLGVNLQLRQPARNASEQKPLLLYQVPALHNAIS